MRTNRMIWAWNSMLAGSRQTMIKEQGQGLVDRWTDRGRTCVQSVQQTLGQVQFSLQLGQFGGLIWKVSRYNTKLQWKCLSVSVSFSVSQSPVRSVCSCFAVSVWAEFRADTLSETNRDVNVRCVGSTSVTYRELNTTSCPSAVRTVTQDDSTLCLKGCYSKLFSPSLFNIKVRIKHFNKSQLCMLVWQHYENNKICRIADG